MSGEKKLVIGDIKAVLQTMLEDIEISKRTHTSGGRSAAHNHGYTTSSTGAGNAENMQPTLFLNVMVKL